MTNIYSSIPYELVIGYSGREYTWIRAEDNLLQSKWHHKKLEGLRSVSRQDAFVSVGQRSSTRFYAVSACWTMNSNYSRRVEQILFRNLNPVLCET